MHFCYRHAFVVHNIMAKINCWELKLWSPIISAVWKLQLSVGKYALPFVIRCCCLAQLEKRRKRLKVKLEMAKFLQDTIEETALQRRDGSGTEGEATVQEFVKFMDEVPIFDLTGPRNIIVGMFYVSEPRLIIIVIMVIMILNELHEFVSCHVASRFGSA